MGDELVMHVWQQKMAQEFAREVWKYEVWIATGVVCAVCLP